MREPKHSRHLRVAAGIAGLLEAHAKRQDEGKPISSRTLRRLAKHLMAAVRALDKMLR